MLPQIKRPARADDGEVEIEVVDVRNVDGTDLSDDDPTMLATNTLFPKGSGQKGSVSSRPPSGRPNISLGNLTNKKAAFGDEPTRLMPGKHGARPASVRPPPAKSSAPPPASVGHAPPVPSSRNPRVAPPPAFRDREESKTMLRPLGALNDQSIHEPKVSISVPSAGAIKAQVDKARAKRLADQKARAAETLEVTGVSISERFVVEGRPAAPWAIAFVAMGIFAGLATAVFTGGRASAIAAFIDPAHELVAAAAAQPALQSVAPAAAPAAIDPAANMLTSTPAPNSALGSSPLDVAPATPSVFAVGRASAKPADPPAVHAPKSAPVAKADPKPEPKADPKPASDSKTADNSSSVSHSSPKPATASHGKHGGGDVDSAAAADALAKAQLENSL